MEVVDRIMKAATEVFARSGYSGARVAEIAQLARVNKATIYYHIGGKEDLYREVLHGVISKVADELDHVFSSPLKPWEKIQAYVDTINRVMEENPHVPPIVIRELATGGEHIPQLVIEDLIKIIQRLGQVITEGVMKGELFPIHPLLLHIMTAGSLALYRTAGDVISRLPRLHDVPLSSEVGSQVKEIITRAIKRR